ncbi:MAG: hypothetical protein M3M97_07085 [Actinomycetota bacterium]|nr:hypothetical protein [Actinomycetota bacterium]
MIHNKNALSYLRTLVLAGLVALLVAGCQGGTTGAEVGGEPGETKRTLGLLEDLVANCNDMLGKIAGRKEDYASTGNVRGEQLMGEAANNVKDMRTTAFAIKRDIAPAETASISLVDRANSPPDVQAKVQEIYEARDRLEGNLAEAKSCCGLAPDFLDENLEKVRTQTNNLEEQVEQIEPERSAQEEQYS